MIFGNTTNFAVEAILEPGPEFPMMFGSNVAGRFRLFFDDTEVGNFHEPCCVLRSLSEHLVTLCSAAHSLWHFSLESYGPDERFKILNEALFTGDASSPSEYQLTSFLTNISEALNSVKGFLLCPPDGDNLQVLLKLQNIDGVCHHTVRRTNFCVVAAQFAQWLREQEHELLQIA